MSLIFDSPRSIMWRVCAHWVQVFSWAHCSQILMCTSLRAVDKVLHCIREWLTLKLFMLLHLVLQKMKTCKQMIYCEALSLQASLPLQRKQHGWSKLCLLDLALVLIRILFCIAYGSLSRRSLRQQVSLWSPLPQTSSISSGRTGHLLHAMLYSRCLSSTQVSNANACIYLKILSYFKEF
jgi:hypothetical protein